MVTTSDSMSAAQATNYFEKDNYYIKDGVTEKGQWFGETANSLALNGDINMKDFYAVSNGINPSKFSDNDFQTLKTLDKTAGILAIEFNKINKLPDGKGKDARLKNYQALCQTHNDQQKALNETFGNAKMIRDTLDKNTGILEHGRAGFDMTFSAPKSISTLALVAGDERLIDAHKASVGEVMDYIQRHFFQTREYIDGERRHVNTENIAAAQFHHYTARSADGQTPDPQLHTHNFIFNLTRNEDGVMRSLSNEEILKTIKFAGQLYQNSLANKAEALGYATGWEKTGSNYTFAIKGINKEMLDHFGKRHDQIELAVINREQEIGRSLTHAEKIEFKREAVLLTRESKQAQNLNELHDDWNKQIAGFGLDKDSLLLSTKNQTSNKTISHDSYEAIIRAVETLDASKSVFSQHDILYEAAKAVQGKASLADLQNALVANTKSHRAFLIESSDTYELGKSSHNSKTNLFSSKDILRAEGNIFKAVDNGKDTGEIMGKDSFAELKVKTDSYFREQSKITGEEYHGLTEGQADGMEHIATSKDRIIGIQGDAGTGKTTMLAHLNHAIGDKVELIGLAATGKAAAEIEAASGIESKTIDSFFLTKGDTKGAGKAKVFIVDEASMVGTKKIEILIEKAEEMNAKIVFLGDSKQLKAIEAGDMFTKLKEHGMSTSEMTQGLRQKTDMTKDVVHAFKSAATLTSGIDRLASSGKLIEATRDGGLDYVKRKFVENSAADYQQYGLTSTIALVTKNSERRELNSTIRAELQNLSVVSKDGIKTETLSQRNFSKTDEKFSGNYRVGDILISKKMQGDIKTNKKTMISSIDRENNMIKLSYSASDGKKEKWIDADKADRFTVYAKEDREFAVGDKISFEKNDKVLGVRNGETAVIKDIDKETGCFVVNKDNQDLKINPKEYPHLNYAYAMTTHKSQGQSVDHVHIFADSKNGINSLNAGYVQMSRAKIDLNLYTDDRERLVQKYKQEQLPDNAIDHMNSKEQIKEFAELHKIRDAARTIADEISPINMAKEPDSSLLNVYKHAATSKAVRERLGGSIKQTRAGQLKAMEERLLKYGKIDLSDSASHALRHGYYFNGYSKTINRMEARLNQLHKQNFVTKKDNIFTLEKSKKQDFERNIKSSISSIERQNIGSKGFSETFKKNYRVIANNKAFIGRKYGKGIEGQINAGIDKILNETFAFSVAIVAATTKFVAMKILGYATKEVRETAKALSTLKRDIKSLGNKKNPKQSLVDKVAFSERLASITHVDKKESFSDRLHTLMDGNNSAQNKTAIDKNVNIDKQNEAGVEERTR